MNRLDIIKGCLLGGAVGDALGAPVEFLEWPAIEAKFGPSGIVDFALAYGFTGAITDDTQMMLFTAEGLIRAFVRGSLGHTCHVPSVIHHALLRWLMTQDCQSAMPVSRDGWLIDELSLWSRRAPGTTCLSALKASTRLGMLADNDSKGCGAVIRIASCAFFGNAFEYAAESGRLTHGHPTGYMAAGLFADILQRMVDRQGKRRRMSHGWWSMFPNIPVNLRGVPHEGVGLLCHRFGDRCCGDEKKPGDRRAEERIGPRKVP